jgi:hypothetical protein
MQDAPRRAMQLVSSITHFVQFLECLVRMWMHGLTSLNSTLGLSEEIRKHTLVKKGEFDKDFVRAKICKNPFATI